MPLQQQIPVLGVFSASRSHPDLLPLAEKVGREIAHRGGAVVNGGGAGLMAAVSKGAHQAGASVTGITPHDMFQAEWSEHSGELFLVGTLHERKERMYDLSQTGFIALPGGLGTLAELTEAAERSQLGLHEDGARKLVVLLGPMGYWDPFLQQLDTACAFGLLTARDRDLITSVTTAGDALDALGVHARPEAGAPA